ncbi:C-C motif chemokine 17-like [Brienomyrus brachyistius]|uniref:C-C motif chemokine 17-like n=1 Tax=Brienomyrus brachyistius TaxID=42636 RepID=UPI0020B230FC|nr:C-C motif chemokine 17-like [Brienomyrus brachyistius]
MKPLSSLPLGPASLLLLLVSLTAIHSSGPVVTCCLKTSKTVQRVQQIRNYYQQSAGLCPVDAVIFVVGRKKAKICSSPAEPWVRKAMKYVDNRKRRRVRGEQEVPRKKKPTSVRRRAPPAD